MDTVYDLGSTVLSIRGGLMLRVACFALPAAALATALRILKQTDRLHSFFGELDILADNAPYTGFTGALGFLLVFRTSQSYSRYWEGITLGHRMFAEWHDFTSSVIAFTKTSKVDIQKIVAFRQRLARLVSLLHATASASLRTMECTHFELLDPDGLEKRAMQTIANTEFPTTLMGQWILELVMEGLDQGIVSAPPPIVSRAFQEFSNGMVVFHDGMKLATTPFPFPYSQITVIMLLTHLGVTPFVMCNWVLWPTWTFILTFLLTSVFWSLFFTAQDIENPFKPGDTRSQYEATRVQKEFNSCLLLMLSAEARAAPDLTSEAMSGNLDELASRRVVRSVRIVTANYQVQQDELISARSAASSKRLSSSIYTRSSNEGVIKVPPPAEDVEGQKGVQEPKPDPGEQQLPLDSQEPQMNAEWQEECLDRGQAARSHRQQETLASDRPPPEEGGLVPSDGTGARNRSASSSPADRGGFLHAGPTPMSSSSEFSFGPTPVVPVLVSEALPRGVLTL